MKFRRRILDYRGQVGRNIRRPRADNLTLDAQTWKHEILAVAMMNIGYKSTK